MKQYINKSDIADEFQISSSFAGRICREIREDYTGPGKRYGQYAVRGDSNYLQVRYAVLTDYLRYRKGLKDPVAGSYVPAFDIREAERDLGVREDPIYNIQIDPAVVAAEVVKMLALKIGGAI